jgi:putative redox protein
MAIVAQRHSIDLAGLSASIDKEMVVAPVRRIGAIRMTINMPAGLSEVDRQRLENAAQRCPVKQSLHPDIDVRLEFLYPE